MEGSPPLKGAGNKIREGQKKKLYRESASPGAPLSARSLGEEKENSDCEGGRLYCEIARKKSAADEGVAM